MGRRIDQVAARAVGTRPMKAFGLPACSTIGPFAVVDCKSRSGSP